MSDLGYADDIAYVGESNSLDSYGKMIGLNISIKKTKVMANFPINNSLYGETIEQVGTFV